MLNTNKESDFLEIQDFQTLQALKSICWKVMEPAMIALEQSNKRGSEFEFDIETAVINASKDYFNYDIKNTLEHDATHGDDEDTPPPFTLD